MHRKCPHIPTTMFHKEITIIEKPIIMSIDGQYYNDYLWTIKENNIP